MTKASTITVGCAAGFWGDTETAASQLLSSQRLDYLVLDYLAEITMSIMAGAKLKRPDGGYAHDFVTRVMQKALDAVIAQNVKVVTNAGGLNPHAARAALTALCRERGYTPKIALVLGDDLMPAQESIKAAGVQEMFDQRPLPESVLSMNAYLGARPIAAALAAGADIVLTGRVADSALTLGPLMHEFGWAPTDYELLAQGSLAGHMIECGAQATGGLFTDYETVGDYARMGFPLVECAADGSFVLTKPAGTAGLVTPAVALEQLVYEIGDPRAYILPDVTCDFTEVQAEQVGEQRVRISGARGYPPPAQYKVSATYTDGFKTAAAFVLAGERAADKGQRVADALLRKTGALLVERGYGPLRQTRVDILGAESTYGPHRSPHAQQTREVVVRIAASHDNAEALALMLREFPQAGTGMAPGFAAAVAGRSSPAPIIRLFSFLIARDQVQTRVDLDDQLLSIDDRCATTFDAAALPEQQLSYPPVESPVTVPLIALAHGRSGDKGDHCNIGILARQPDYLPLIGAALTEAAVAKYMAHTLDPVRGRVQRWLLKGPVGFNFLLEHSLGGGGIASLRPDPQGKAFAQQLLAFPVPVPPQLHARLSATSDRAERATDTVCGGDGT